MGKIKTSLLLPINRLSVSFTQPNHHQREREREREREKETKPNKQTNKRGRQGEIHARLSRGSALIAAMKLCAMI